MRKIAVAKVSRLILVAKKLIKSGTRLHFSYGDTKTQLALKDLCLSLLIHPLLSQGDFNMSWSSGTSVLLLPTFSGQIGKLNLQNIRTTCKTSQALQYKKII